MMSMHRVAQPLAATALLLVLALAGPARADARRVCAFSFQGPEEIEAFRSHLSGEFRFVDLSPAPLLPSPGGQGAPITALPDGWMANVCRQDLKCDVVLFSAEFAGRFFGIRGSALSLQQMEEAACKPSCAGLFHDPREVFLLACNTLATKDEDLRGPDVYLQVLLDHGFDRASAERVVAMRYGPLGPTFREALRRVFAGVPRIYGFSSVAPKGEYTGPMLDRYFRTVGDYRKHVDGVRLDGPPNRTLASAFRATTLVETTGLQPNESGARDRKLLCALYDESLPVAQRLDIVRELVARPDVLAFVPTIKVFVQRHPPAKMSAAERRVFDEIRGDEQARARVVELVDRLDVSALKLELGHFAVQMGWLAPERFRTLAVASARELLRRPLTNEVVDVMCEMPRYASVGDQFTSSDVPDSLFHDPVGLRVISCLAPRGDQVNAKLALALDDPNPEIRLWAAHALSRRLPLPDAVLLRVAAHVSDASSDVELRLRWILQTQKPLPRSVKRALDEQGEGVEGKASQRRAAR